MNSFTEAEEAAVAQAVAWVLFPEDHSGGEISAGDLTSAWLKVIASQARRRNLPPPINGALNLDERMGW